MLFSDFFACRGIYQRESEAIQAIGNIFQESLDHKHTKKRQNNQLTQDPL